MVFSTHPKPTIYRNLYENMGQGNIVLIHAPWPILICLAQTCDPSGKSNASRFSQKIYIHNIKTTVVKVYVILKIYTVVISVFICTHKIKGTKTGSRYASIYFHFSHMSCSSLQMRQTCMTTSQDLSKV